MGGFITRQLYHIGAFKTDLGISAQMPRYMQIIRGFPGGSDGKESPAIQETWVQSLGQEDPLEKGMATHSSILAWKIPWTEEPGGMQSMGMQTESETTGLLSMYTRVCITFVLQIL